MTNARGYPVASRTARARHHQRHPSAGWVEVVGHRVITEAKARDIRAYMDRGEWHGWPLGVRVPV